MRSWTAARSTARTLLTRVWTVLPASGLLRVAELWLISLTQCSTWDRRSTLSSNFANGTDPAAKSMRPWFREPRPAAATRRHRSVQRSPCQRGADVLPGDERGGHLIEPALRVFVTRAGYFTFGCAGLIPPIAHDRAPSPVRALPPPAGRGAPMFRGRPGDSVTRTGATKRCAIEPPGPLRLRWEQPRTEGSSGMAFFRKTAQPHAG